MESAKSIEELQNFNFEIKKIFEDAQDFLPIMGTDYIELYVGNAKQSAHYYKTAFGFQSEAYAGLETEKKDIASYVLKQGKIRLVLTTSMQKGSDINKHVDNHGDAVKIIALHVEDATKAFNETVKRGAKPYLQPTKEEDEHGAIIKSVLLIGIELAS